MYTALLQELDELRLRTARFRRVALHVHSVNSHDWARSAPDPARNARRRFDGDNGTIEFLGELSLHLDVVAITDHMRCEFACRLSEDSHGNNDCVVLPGMEVNLIPEAALGVARIHFVTILPAGSSLEDFARLFQGQSNIPMDASRTGNEDVRGLSLREWVDRVHEEGGICIAAHVDSSQGVRHHFRQTAIETLKMLSDAESGELEREADVGQSLKDYLFDSGIDAVEIHRTSSAPHYRWMEDGRDKARWITTVLTFDAHCVEEFARAERVTHLKMTNRSLDGLRGALDFPETRIRFPNNLPTTPNPRLLGVRIRGNDESFFEDVTVAFAENLSCLIGVRGSGKSTLVEAMRYAFGYNRTLGEVGEPLQRSIKEMQKANLAGSAIEVVYMTVMGDVRVLQTTFDEKEDYCTKVYASNGDFIDIPDVESTGDFPLRLYGWSEIETLGRSPARQRDLLDRLVPKIQPAIFRRKGVRQEIRDNRTSIEQLVYKLSSAFEANDGTIRRYSEYKSDFEKLNTNEVKGIFSSLDLATEKKSILGKVKINAETLMADLKGPGDATVRSEIETMLNEGSQEVRDWWHGTGSQRLNVSGTEQDVRGFITQAVDRLRSFVSLAQDHVGELETEIAGLQEGLRSQFSADDSMQRIADLRTNADHRLRAVNALRQEYLRRWTALQDAISERKAIVERLTQVQNEIAGIRSRNNQENEETMNSFLPADMQVTISFVPGGDTESFSETLYSIFGARGNQVKKIRRIIERHCTPVDFAAMIETGDFSPLVGKTVQDESGSPLAFAEGDADLCVSKTALTERDESADVEVLADGGSRFKAFLDVQETPWDDHETILLNGGPVNEKSPGQRSSAMLPLIALAERTPLIIDQPEDNLDKRLIGNVLMRVLADLKEQRQIIVCTHDPNILVGGDAEQVIVLEAQSDRKGAVGNHGSIDNDDIVKTVIDLLEGGAEAFESRRRRYGNRV